MRGLMGPGPNQINKTTIRLATEGLARYLVAQQQAGAVSVLIGFDSRHQSAEFALETARVLAAHEIDVYLLIHVRPTPLVSFGIRFKQCTAGIVITASHNPSTYNGYKVYGSDGAQITSPHDSAIVREIAAVETYQLAPIDSPCIHLVGDEIDAAYLEAIRALQLHPQDNSSLGHTLHTVYTSLHGAGITLTPAALLDWGFSSLRLVDKQVTVDGDFPTVPTPNPENQEALVLGTQTLMETQSDLLLAHDADADRVGVVVRHHNTPVTLTGNEIAALCVHYLCETLTEQKQMPTNGAFVTTVVSTQLQKVIAHAYGASCFEVLTGFKHIGALIRSWETMPNAPIFLFGAEESYGYLRGTHARDKDAIVSTCLLCEMALQAKKNGQTLVDKLDEIYLRFGFYKEKQLSIELDDSHQENSTRIAAAMKQLREAPQSDLFDNHLLSVKDYIYDNPQADMLKFWLTDGLSLAIRPSGTEAKIKLYAAICLPHIRCTQELEEAKKRSEEKLSSLLATVRNSIYNIPK